MPSKDFDYSIFQEPQKDWRKYYTDKINVISDWITEYLKDDIKKIDFYEKYIEKINIYDIKNYHYWFTSRFFYWIYDFDRNKWWIRLHWVKADDFLIKVWLFIEWYYDVNILNFKWIFWWKNEIKNWPNVWHKKRFKNNNKECLSLDRLAYKLKLSWANTELNRKITKIKDSFYRWPALLKKLFNSQTKLLRYIRKQDKDRIKLKQSLYHNDNSYYEEKYWYTPEERYKRKYFMMLNYLWKENRIFLKLQYTRNRLYESLTEKYEWDEAWNFIKSVLEISNSINVNFKERKKIILAKYKELFNNK